MEQELDWSEFDSHEKQDNTLSFVPSNIENEVTMIFQNLILTKRKKKMKKKKFYRKKKKKE